MENNNPKDIAELVASSMEDFRESMAANMHELSKPMESMPF